jgi:hypothetical protein
MIRRSDRTADGGQDLRRRMSEPDLHAHPGAADSSRCPHNRLQHVLGTVPRREFFQGRPPSASASWAEEVVPGSEDLQQADPVPVRKSSLTLHLRPPRRGWMSAESGPAFPFGGVLANRQNCVRSSRRNPTRCPERPLVRPETREPPPRGRTRHALALWTMVDPAGLRASASEARDLSCESGARLASAVAHAPPFPPKLLIGLRTLPAAGPAT